MRYSFFFLLAIALSCVALSSTAEAYVASDVYVHYKFDDTSGTAYVDSSLNASNASFYSLPTYSELPTLDASYSSWYGQIGDALSVGEVDVDGFIDDVMINVPTAAHLPGTGDSFAVSFWLSALDWGSMAGPMVSYNYNGLEWGIGGLAADGLSTWSGEADETGNAVFVVNCVDAGLVNDTFNHFVLQFDGAAGITEVYINGTSVADTESESYFWGNEREGITLGGRVLDGRPYTSITEYTYLDDFSIIDGVVDATDISNLMTGAGSLGSRRLMHYEMNETSGSVINDSSSYANHGAIIVNDPATVPTVYDIAGTARAGQVDGAIELAAGRKQHALMDAAGVDAMPVTGEDFTVAFWLKPDENPEGWNNTGVISSWSNDDLGFSVSMLNHGGGAIIVRNTDGTYTGSSSLYAVHVGAGGLELSTDEFHHFAITVDTVGDVTGMYIDGILYDSDYSNGFGVSFPETSVIGGRINKTDGVTPEVTLYAYLDDYGVVSGELTEADIALAMAQGVVALYTDSPQIAGDANEDGKVDGSDVTILANNWQAGVPNGDPENVTWSMGDFNGDGKVDGSDVTILANNWQYGVLSAAASVPEPSTLILILCSALSFFALRWKKKGKLVS